MTNVSSEKVLNALRRVQDPDLKQDLVTLNMIRDLKVEGGHVSLRVVLTTPACPLKGKIEADVREAVSQVEGVREVQVRMDAEVKGRKSTQSQNGIPGVQNIIAVSSGKGGVGKSTVAVNLATSLALAGGRVGLMDADIYGPNLPTMMGVAEMPSIQEVAGVGEVFIPPARHGVKVISMGFLTERDQPMIWRGPMLHSIVQQFCHRVSWGELDYLVVDMPPGTGDVQLSLAQLVPVTGAVMVTTPQEVSMQDVRRALKMWDQVKIPVLGIVENMSTFICDGCEKAHALFGSGGGRRLAEKFQTELLAELPLQMAVREGGDEGEPAVIRAPQSPVALAFRALAGKVAQKIAILSNSGQGQRILEIGRFH